MFRTVQPLIRAALVAHTAEVTRSSTYTSAHKLQSATPYRSEESESIRVMHCNSRNDKRYTQKSLGREEHMDTGVLDLRIALPHFSALNTQFTFFAKIYFRPFGLVAPPSSSSEDHPSSVSCCCHML